MGAQVPIRSPSAGYRKGLVSQLGICGLSSVGDERDPYKFDVGGSIPSAHTNIQQTDKAVAHGTGRWDASGLVVLYILLNI